MYYRSDAEGRLHASQPFVSKMSTNTETKCNTNNKNESKILMKSRREYKNPVDVVPVFVLNLPQLRSFRDWATVSSDRLVP